MYTNVAKHNMEPETWKLEPVAKLGTWNLEPGTWNLEPGTWNLEPGTWNLEPGTWRTWNLEPGNKAVSVRAVPSYTTAHLRSELPTFCGRGVSKDVLIASLFKLEN